MAWPIMELYFMGLSDRILSRNGKIISAKMDRKITLFPCQYIHPSIIHYCFDDLQD
jgi:hypothetical protein